MSDSDHGSMTPGRASGGLHGDAEPLHHDHRDDRLDEAEDDGLDIKPPQKQAGRKSDRHSSRHKHGKNKQRSHREDSYHHSTSSSSRNDRHRDKGKERSKDKSRERREEVHRDRERKEETREAEARRREKSKRERERLERIELERRRLDRERELRERDLRELRQEQQALSRQTDARQVLDAKRSSRAAQEERHRQGSRAEERRRDKERHHHHRHEKSHRSRSPLVHPSQHEESSSRKHAKEYEEHVEEYSEQFEQDFEDDEHHRHPAEEEDIEMEHHEEPQPYEGEEELHEHDEEIEEEQPRARRRRRSELEDGEHSDQSSSSDSSSDSDSGQEDGSAESERHSSGSDQEHHHSAGDNVRSKFDDLSDQGSDHGSVEEEEEEEEIEEQEEVEAEEVEEDPYPVEESPPSPPAPKLPPYLPALQGCRNVEEFHCLNRIEEGTYGVVYRARDKKMDEIVALKRLKMEQEKDGFPITSLREINTLLKAQHQNIVTVREIVVGSNMDKIYIVMDYVEHDLKSLMSTMKEPFMIGEVKTLLLQLLRGVAHLHDNWIIHRDLKTSNLLLSHSGILKIADFGLAREYGSPLKPYTPIVVTLWYRAPELLLGTKQYSTPIDIWSVGCIFAEILNRKPLFPGKSEIDELNRIFKELGTPNEKIWPGVSELPYMKKCTFTEYPYNQLRNKFGTTLSETGFDLLNKFLTYNPSRRVAAENAKRHPYFMETPLPVSPSMFPTWPAKSEMSRTRSHGNSPKPPSGGKAYAKLVGADDESAGFVLGMSKNAPKGAGFALKF